LDSRNAQTSLRCHSAHICAELSIFSFCVCKLKKLANTKVARKQKSKIFCYLRRTPVQLIFQQKRFFSLRLPRVMAKRREMQNKLLCFFREAICSAARNKAENDRLLAVATKSLDFVAQNSQMPQRLLVTTKR